MSWKGGSESIRLALDVWDFALPQESHLPGDIWNGSMRNMPPEEELAYYQLARQHRFTPLIYAYRPELSIDGFEGDAGLDGFRSAARAVSRWIGIHGSSWLLGSGLRIAARSHHASVQ